MRESWKQRAQAAGLLAVCACAEGATRALDASTQEAGPLTAEVTSASAADAAATLAPPLDASAAAAASPELARVSIQFQARIGARQLACGESYEGFGRTGVRATPQDLRFFVQAARLVGSDGRELPIEFDERAPFQTRELALIDLTEATGSCRADSPQTQRLLEGRVERQPYQGLVLVIGVPEQINHGNPARAPQPLRAPGVSWNWLGGYRFFIAEMRQVGALLDGAVESEYALPDGGLVTPGLGFVHLGSTACQGNDLSGYRCDRQNRAEIRLPGFDPARHQVIVDPSAIFAESDLAHGAQCHGSDADCAAMYRALGVDFASGTTLPAQQVFRYE